MSTGELLKKLRNQKGLTQEEVASKLEINHNTYVRYENGLRLPNLEATAKLCEFYQITPVELISGEIDQTKNTPPTETEDDVLSLRNHIRNNPELRVLYEVALRSTPEHIRAAAAMLRALKGNQDD